METKSQQQPTLSQSQPLPSDKNKLNSGEYRLMETITKDNSKMRRKLQYIEAGNEEPRKPRRPKRVPVKVFVKDAEEITTMRKKLQDLEKLQDMYKGRIQELEQQVSTFSMFHILNNPAVKDINDKRNPHQYQHNDTKQDLPSAQPNVSIRHRTKKQDDGILIPVADSIVNDEFLKFTKAPTNPPAVSTEEIKLLALYDYQTDRDGKLSFKEGEVLVLINGKGESGWWTAKNSDGKIGRIPSNFVEKLNPSKSFRARVTKNFESKQFGDLSIMRGELVTILKKQENGWYLGEKGTKCGFFPTHNVEKLASIKTPSA